MTPKWTKIEEGMPPLDSTVLVTFIDIASKRDVRAVKYDSNRFSKKPKPRFEEVGTGRIFDKKVISWMTFPEPDME
jgi:hypothetical protein